MYPRVYSQWGGKVLVRVPSLKAYHEFFQLTAEEESKIAQSLDEANVEATRLEEDMRLLFQKRHLPDGVWLVRTDTGEVIAEAERIIRDGNSNSS